MTSESFFEKFKQTVSKYEVLIAYKPLHDDIDYTTIPIFKNIFRIPILVSDDKTSDPYIWAERMKTYSADRAACVLIPGRRFDLLGTRHGRGGGWYDKFLSKIPEHWIRIGIADKSKLSSQPLKRELWDQPVDWILYCDHDLWHIYETHARGK